MIFLKKSKNIYETFDLDLEGFNKINLNVRQI